MRWAAAFAVFVVGGAVGAAIAWRVERPAAQMASSAGGPSWVQRAAVAHSVYVPEAVSYTHLTLPTSDLV